MIRLSEAIVQLETALNAITGLPNLSFRPVHPDMLEAADLPHFSLAPDDEDRGDPEEGDRKWIIPVNTLANLVNRLYINTAADALGLEIVRQVEAVQDAIRTLTSSDIDFRCRISRVDYVFEPAGKWAAAQIFIQIGAYDA